MKINPTSFLQGNAVSKEWNREVIALIIVNVLIIVSFIVYLLPISQFAPQITDISWLHGEFKFFVKKMCIVLLQ